MKVLFLVGPTAAGKSALAMQLAKHLRAPIINADSVQFYSEIQIGAAKPTATELSEVSHHLVGHVRPPQVFTAGDFRRAALDVLKALESEGQEWVLVVGGSGFYLQALEKGMFEVGKVSTEIRKAVEDEAAQLGGLARLHAELMRADCASAVKIPLGDTYRIKRAVEVLREFGKSPRQLQENFVPQRFPYSYQKWGVYPGREPLRERVTERTLRMLREGLLQEVRGLIQSGLRDWAPLQSVGYAECVEVLEGRVPEAELAALITQNTMRLAKRQMTWFRRDSSIQWLDSDLDFTSAVSQILQSFS